LPPAIVTMTTGSQSNTLNSTAECKTTLRQLLLFIHQMSSNALLPHTAADEDDVGECKHDVTLTKSTTSVDSKAALKPEKAHMVSAPALNSIAALKST